MAIHAKFGLWLKHRAGVPHQRYVAECYLEWLPRAGTRLGAGDRLLLEQVRMLGPAEVAYELKPIQLSYHPPAAELESVRRELDAVWWLSWVREEGRVDPAPAAATLSA